MIITEDEKKQAIRDIIFESAPENRDRLQNIWDIYSPNLLLSSNNDYGISANSLGILFTQRTLELIWALGFAAWKTLYSYGVVLKIYNSQSDVFNFQSIITLNGQDEAHADFEYLISLIRGLPEVESAENFFSRGFIPSPNEFMSRMPEDQEKEATVILICKATAYIFLHEVKHIIFAQDGNSPNNDVEEEIECDKFARSILLDNIDKCIRQNNKSPEGFLRLRAMGIALANFVIFEMTPQELWGETRSHPSIAARIKVLIDGIGLPPQDNFWIFINCLLLSKLKVDNLTSEEFGFNNNKNLCYNILNYLNNLH